MNPWNIIGWFIVIVIALNLALGFGLLTDPEKPDYEGQANCIAEYDYHHPERPQMDNLVAALKTCK